MSKPFTTVWKTKRKAEWSRVRGPVTCASSPLGWVQVAQVKMGPSAQGGTIVSLGVFKELELLHLETEHVPLCKRSPWVPQDKIRIEAGTKEIEHVEVCMLRNLVVVRQLKIQNSSIANTGFTCMWYIYLGKR